MTFFEIYRYRTGSRSFCGLEEHFIRRGPEWNTRQSCPVGSSCPVACRHSLTERTKGMKVAGPFDLIRGGKTWKTLFVWCAYFRKPRRAAVDGQTEERRDERRLKEAGSTPGQAGKTAPKVGQVYIMQLGSSVMARTCYAVGTIMVFEYLHI